MLGRTTELSTTPKKLSRASSRNELSGMNRDLLEMILDDKAAENQAASGRRRTFSQGSYKNYSRSSKNASVEGSPLNLRRKTLNASLQKRSRDEDSSVPTSPKSPVSRSISLDCS